MNSLKEDQESTSYQSKKGKKQCDDFFAQKRAGRISENEGGRGGRSQHPEKKKDRYLYPLGARKKKY